MGELWKPFLIVVEKRVFLAPVAIAKLFKTKH